MLPVERLQVAGLPPLSFEVPAGECLAVEGHSVLLVSHDQAQVERLSHARLLLPKANGATERERARRS